MDFIKWIFIIYTYLQTTDNVGLQKYTVTLIQHT